ncbi:MAG: hypothetical protein V1709_12065 [Planctomycetota bacterium]
MNFKDWCKEICDCIKNMTAKTNEHSIKLFWSKPLDYLEDYNATVKRDLNLHVIGPEDQDGISRVISTDKVIFLPPLSKKDLIANLGLYAKGIDRPISFDDAGNPFLFSLFNDYTRVNEETLSLDEKNLLSMIKNHYANILKKFDILRDNFESMDKQIQNLTSSEIKELLPSKLLCNFVEICIDYGTVVDAIFLLGIEYAFEEYASTPFSDEYDRYIKELAFTKKALSKDHLREEWKRFLEDKYGNPQDFEPPLNIGLYQWYMRDKMYYHAIAVCEFLMDQIVQNEERRETFYENGIIKDLIYCYKEIGDNRRSLSLVSEIIEDYKRGLISLDPDDYINLCLEENDLQVLISKTTTSEREGNLRKYLEESKLEIQKLETQIEELNKQMEVALPLSELKAFQEGTSAEQYEIREQRTRSKYQEIWEKLSKLSKEQLIHSKIFLSINLNRQVVHTMSLALELELRDKIFPLLNDPNPTACKTLGDIIYLIYREQANKEFLNNRGRFFRNGYVNKCLSLINEHRKQAVHSDYPDYKFQEFQDKIIKSGFYKKILCAIIAISSPNTP